MTTDWCDSCCTVVKWGGADHICDPERVTKRIDELKAELAKAKAEYDSDIDAYVNTITPYWYERAVKAEAEVERLTWMLDRCLHDFMETVEGEWGLHDDESYESWLADLARRWEERDD